MAIFYFLLRADSKEKAVLVHFCNFVVISTVNHDTSLWIILYTFYIKFTLLTMNLIGAELILFKSSIQKIIWKIS